MSAPHSVQEHNVLRIEVAEGVYGALAAPVNVEVAAPIEDAAVVSGEAAEAPLEEEKADEVAGVVDL